MRADSDGDRLQKVGGSNPPGRATSTRDNNNIVGPDRLGPRIPIGARRRVLDHGTGCEGGACIAVHGRGRVGIAETAIWGAAASLFDCQIAVEACPIGRNFAAFCDVENRPKGLGNDGWKL